MSDRIQKIVEQLELSKRLYQEWKDVVTNLENALIEELGEDLRQAFDAKDYGCGSVSMPLEDGRKVEVVIPKRVSWDQDIMQTIYDDIVNNGANPKEYMTVKYNVSETSYKAWPKIIQNQFIVAREVKPGKASIKIKKAKKGK